jgi:glycosyltransferase involved in cell wall biosynthesis
MEILGACDVLLHPSLHDSGGYACVEAMACGKPIICLDLGGPATLVDSECGIKVKAGDPEQTLRDLAGALRLLAQDSVLRARLGTGARRVVAARCDWDHKGDLVYGKYARSLARQNSDAA